MNLISRSRQTTHAKQLGIALTEMSAIVPFLLLLLFGIIDIGRAWGAYMLLQNAAYEGARYGASVPNLTSGDYSSTFVPPSHALIVGRVNEVLEGYSINTSNKLIATALVDEPFGNSGETRKVIRIEIARPLDNMLLFRGLTVHTSSIAPYVRF